ncbi:MAG TPA: chemotaxis protein CheD [Bryobacteraceae bacterium]|nr:chemotaxis protein CheD [Bryobacteraceae bacterium]
MAQIVVGMADCRISNSPGEVLTTFALGSCIGLVVHDSAASIGGLLHFMLPDSAIDPARGRDHPFMFADTGIPLLLSRVCSLGASRCRLTVYAVGGAQMMDQQGVFEIGKRNYLAVRKILWKAGVLIHGEVVGGNNSRTLRLEIGSGKLWLQEAGSQREILPGQQKG